nr:MAG TPA: major capsid protein [Caudoviricetes sp.]
MSVTTMADIINPEVMGPAIDAKIDALAKITPYAKVDTTLVGVAGDSVTVPCWNYIGDAEDIAEGGEITPTKLTASSTKFKIKKAMKSVSISQEAVNSGYGNPVGQAETQLAKSIIGKVDSDLVAAAYTSSNTYDGSAGTIGYKGIVAANGKFEDEEDEVEKVLFIHPDQETQMLVDPDFLSADKFTDGVAVKGAIGKVAGAWVKKSRKVVSYLYTKNTSGTITIVADSTAETETKLHLATVQAHCADTLAVGDKVNALETPYYLNPIIKIEPDSEETDYTEDELPALTIYLKADTKVDAEWFPKKQITDVTACKYYGVALTNAAKVVVARFKTA